MPTTVPARVVIGVDVARFGRDRSVITVRRGNVVEDIQVYPYIDTMALAGPSCGGRPRAKSRPGERG